MPEFRLVAHQTVVDIDKRLALTNDIVSAVLYTDEWQMLKHIGGIADIGQRTVLDVDGQTVGCRSNKIPFHSHAFQRVVVGLHPDSTDIPGITETGDGLIAHKGASQNHTVGICGDDEVAGLVAQTTADKRGIGRAEQRDTCISDRLAMFIDYPSFQIVPRFVGTLHKILVMVSDDADRPEAYYLHQGLIKAQALEAAGDGEVLQIVIDKRYLIAGSSGVEVFEHATERLTLITACDLLGISQAERSTQEEQHT